LAGAKVVHSDRTSTIGRGSPAIEKIFVDEVGSRAPEATSLKIYLSTIASIRRFLTADEVPDVRLDSPDNNAGVMSLGVRGRKPATTAWTVLVGV